MRQRFTPIRIVLCLLGNIILGIGVAVTNFGNLGIDPFNGMCMSVAHIIHIAYAPLALAVNLVFFGFEIAFGKRFIFVGTFINWFLFSYVVTFVSYVIHSIFGIPDPVSFPMRFVCLVSGLLFMGLGLALYQHADLGVSPYDSVPLMIHDHFPRIPYFAGKIAADTFMLLCIILVGNPTGKIGIGTALTAFCLGPVIQFFTNLFFPSEKSSDPVK